MHETVGHGSYGKVKRCVDTTDGHTYAAKVVNKSILKRKRVGRFGTALDNIKKELSIWKKLNHDNVVNLIEIIDDPGNTRHDVCADSVVGKPGSSPNGDAVYDWVLLCRQGQVVHDLRVC